MENPGNNSKPGPGRAEDGVLTTPDGHALPRVLDPAVTMDLVQRYVESERIRSRRVLVLAGTAFLFIVLVLLAAFISIGIYVLRNSHQATRVAADLHARTIGYTVEVVSLSNQVDGVVHGQKEVKEAVRKVESSRVRESQVLKSDLERFGKWVAANDSKSARLLSELEARVKDMTEEAAAKEKELAAMKEQYAALQARDVEPTVRKSGDVPPVVPDGSREQGVRDEPDTGMAAATSSLSPGGDHDGTAAESATEPRRTPSPEEISVVTFPSGDRYEGEFRDGLMNGWGAYYYRNGDRYEGEFRNDMKNGKGTFTYRQGDKYMGEFKDDMKNGRGSYLFRNGDRYVGEFQNDMVNGKGTLVYQNGNKYAGDFKSGLKQGNGIFNFVNGDVYEGEFKGDVREGRGTYSFGDGTKYIGDFRNGQRHGKGRYIYAGGEEYVGDFKNGKKDGSGTCIYPDGKRLNGLWKEDQFVKALEG